MNEKVDQIVFLNEYSAFFKPFNALWISIELSQRLKSSSLIYI